MRIYKSQEKDFDLPNLDLLTFLFESSWCQALEDTEIHVEAENPANGITKSEARDLVRRLAHGFRQHFDIGRDGPNKDVVLTMSSGNAFIPIAFYSVVCAGGVFSAASTAFTVGELVRQVKAGGNAVKVLLCSAEFEEKMVAAAKECNISLDKVLIMDFSVPKQWRLNSVTNSLGFPEINGPMLHWERITDRKKLRDSIICLLYSSGTTGLPKGVLLSHWNCVCGNIGTMHAGMRLMNKRKEETGKPFEFRTIGHLPMAHIAGVEVFSICPFYCGGTTYWMSKFDFTKFIEYSKQFRTTYQFSVPPIWLQIAKSPSVTNHFDSLEAASSGAAPMGLNLQKEVSSKLGKGRFLLNQCYGTTETCGNIAALRWDVRDETGSVGDILVNIRVRLVDEEGKDVEQGAPGEVLVSGPIVSNGYHNNPEATAAAFTRDTAESQGSDEGDQARVWYHTGDIAVYKNNLIYIVDRKKELIKYKGLQVAPAELEAILVSHPKILDAAVIGVDSAEIQTEVPKAYVVPAGATNSATSQVTEEEIKAFVKENLASHKQLRGGVMFVDEIPKSASGKILRKELRAWHQQSLSVKAKL